MELTGPVVPRPAGCPDRILPILIAASLVVHATVMLPSLIGPMDTAVAPPKEIPVEIIQLPPKAAEKPKVAEKPKAPAPPAPKPRQVAQKPQPRKVAAKPQSPLRPTPVSASERLKDLLGPMPAIALPGSTRDGTEEVAYSQLVLSKVAKAKKEGHYRGVPGAASVTFRLGDSGEVASVSIVRPSGDQSLDDEAIAMVKRGAPYPPPPPGGRRDYTITLRFEPLI